MSTGNKHHRYNLESRARELKIIKDVANRFTKEPGFKGMTQQEVYKKLNELNILTVKEGSFGSKNANDYSFNKKDGWGVVESLEAMNQIKNGKIKMKTDFQIGTLIRDRIKMGNKVNKQVDRKTGETTYSYNANKMYKLDGKGNIKYDSLGRPIVVKAAKGGPKNLTQLTKTSTKQDKMLNGLRTSIANGRDLPNHLVDAINDFDNGKISKEKLLGILEDNDKEVWSYLSGSE